MTEVEVEHFEDSVLEDGRRDVFGTCKKYA